MQHYNQLLAFLSITTRIIQSWLKQLYGLIKSQLRKAQDNYGTDRSSLYVCIIVIGKEESSLVDWLLE